MKGKQSQFVRSDKYYQSLLDQYFGIYDLGCITNELHVSPSLLDYCQKGKIFVLVVLANYQKEIFYRNAQPKFSGWEIPGGFIRESDSGLESAAARIVKEESNLTMDELIPLTLVRNRYVSDKKYHDHNGLAFFALVRNQTANIKKENYIGMFAKQAPDSLILSDKKIIKCAQQYLNKVVLNPPIDEIDENSNLGWHYSIHKFIVRPIQRLFSSRVLRKAIAHEIVGNTLLDVSCGDDPFIVTWANSHKNGQYIANDICWNMIRKIQLLAKHNNIIFTNHDINELPYVKKFDTVLFKNTLHHFQNDQAVKTIQKLLQLSAKKLIIIDVEDPVSTKLSHKLWNKYYRHFLHDQGSHFWHFEDFRRTIKTACPNAYFKQAITNRGSYMMACINV